MIPNKDKEAFEKWELDYFGQNDNCPHYMLHIKNTWYAACEYMRNKSNPLDALSLFEKLERERAENKKLRDALENIETK